MAVNNIYTKAEEIKKFVTASDDIKVDILAKYGIIADVIYGGTGFDVIKNNSQTFNPLMSKNVIKLILAERGKPLFNSAIQRTPRLSRLMDSEANAINAIQKLCSDEKINFNDTSSFDDVIIGLRLFGIENATDISEEEITLNEDLDIELDVDFDDLEQENTEPVETVEGYIEKIHGGHRKQIEALILSAWEDLYGYHVDGKEIVDGFIVPGGAILGTGENIKYEGILTLNTNKVDIKPSTLSNAIHEEFILSCKECGIDIIKEVSDNEGEVKPFKYNPLLQRRIASGVINKEAFKLGWREYSRALAPYIVNKTKELAIKRTETGSDLETFKTLSGYIISLMVVNYKDGLGTQLRMCCGDTSKTAIVAQRLVARLKDREKTHRSISQGKMVVGDAIVAESSLSATITIYQNMAGYNAVPQFMGELLCNLNEGMFKPSLNKMIIGLDLKNNIVTAPFTKWLLPIIAGSRSGKGVLTLNMLLNVIGCGAPLFYLDGKPDMAALLWKLQEKYGIKNAIVIDGIGFEGVTEVDRKPFRAPYYENIKKMMESETSDEVLETNFGVMIYLKTLMVILLSCRYYKDKMGSCYGDIFVVFDEVFKIMKTQLETFIMNIDLEISKLDRSEKERKDELSRMKMWVHELLSTFMGNDVGVFGAGIKAVSLTQFAQDGQYNVNGFTVAKQFCTNFLLKRGVKVFGRQEGGSGMYGVSRDKNDEVKFELYDKYFHFGIGSETGNNYNSLTTFKPLLVLNENDCRELTGKDHDGAFTADMLGRIAMYSDVEQFREKYFTNKELAESLGFEGSLAQVGRLLGVDWREMLHNSMARSYEIVDKTLRYYGIIGTDNIASVYDYICSFENKHLWTYNEIIKAKLKGSTPSGGVAVGESVFGDFSSDDFDVDFGNNDSINGGNEQVSNRLNTGGFGEVGGFGVGGFGGGGGGGFGGVKKQLSEEESSVLRDIHDRRNTVSYIDPKPDEVSESVEEPMFTSGGKTGKTIFINPDMVNNSIKLTDENSIMAKLDESHPLEKYEKTLFKSLKGSNYEFNKRWESILNSVGNRIGKDLITRVMLVQDEMYVNGRFVCTVNIVGGFANIRLEDLVNFKKLFKSFRNITELTLDLTMVERFQIEQPNLPAGFFTYNDKLLKVNILLENGAKEVIDRRDSAVTTRTKDTIEYARHRNQLDTICAAKNPRLRETSPGYQNKVWNVTKSVGDKGWVAVRHQITKKNPSFMKAAGIGLLTGGIMAVGGAVYGVGKIFSLFRR